MKSRIAKVVLLSACLASVALFGFVYAADTWHAWQEGQVRLEASDQKLQNMKKFEVALNDTIDAVSEQNLPLADAVDRVENEARETFPDFLDFLNAQPDPRNACLKERIAQSIISQLTVRETADDESSDVACVVKRLKRELIAMHNESKV
jgi:hypothetical protein